MSSEHVDGALEAYLRVLAGEQCAGQLLDVRWAGRAPGMRRRFIPAARLAEAARLIRAIAPSADVYIGVALRARLAGGKSAIVGSHLVYVECDRAPVRELLLAQPALTPTIEIASGTAEHCHLYWRLRTRAPSARVESANRRLALALGGDLRSVDIARILRPPETFNHKAQPPRAVRLLALRFDARYSLAELLERLPPDPSPQPDPSSGSSTAARSELDRALRAIPPSRYVRELTGREADRAGKVLCPFHRETRPSLQLYRDGSFYCFGCRRGGSIIDFAAATWGYGTRGDQFLVLRARLAERFGLDEFARR
ncbi:MAG TPA: CHC2 zinc finger domain-containing protein [Solirubrobacteraceae bacterium]|nr:CHC2 zinc finger domain-containing protein [Solirubrobacteraceae bacterium]